MKINKDICALVARLILGGIFIVVGWMKISDMPATVGFFAQIGLPAFLAYAVGYAEFLGGILLVLGLYVQCATLVLTVIMIGAVYFTRSMGFQVFSSPLETLGGVIALMASGAGKYAVRFKKSAN